MKILNVNNLKNSDLINFLNWSNSRFYHFYKREAEAVKLMKIGLAAIQQNKDSVLVSISKSEINELSS